MERLDDGFQLSVLFIALTFDACISAERFARNPTNIVQRQSTHGIIDVQLLEMSTFQPNCTLPPTGVNFVRAANARGTLDIAWSSLSVVLLCTWTVLHLNVPAPIRTHGAWIKLGLMFERTLDKLKWMALTVVAPELLFGKALVDCLSASFSKDEMKDLRTKARESNDWSLTHAYIANMGGFALDFRDIAKRRAIIKPNAGEDSGIEKSKDQELEHRELQSYSKNGAGGPFINTVTPATPENYGNEIPASQVKFHPKPAEPTVQTESEEHQAEIVSVVPTSGKRKAVETVQDIGSASREGDPHRRTSTTSSRQSTKLQRQQRDLKELRDSPPTSQSRGQPGILSENVIEDDNMRDVYDKTLKTHSTRYGEEVWCIDDTNSRLVVAAMPRLTEQNASFRLRSRQRNLLALQGNVWILDAAQLRLAREYDLLPTLPSITD
jgi:hypothetical protein